MGEPVKPPIRQGAYVTDWAGLQTQIKRDPHPGQQLTLQLDDRIVTVRIEISK